MMTRAALFVEEKDKNGNPVVVIYHLAINQMRLEREFDHMFNVFDGATRSIRPTPMRLTVDAYLKDANPRPWNGPMPGAEQGEIDPVHLAITSNEDPDEIVIDEDDIEDHWRKD